MLSAAPSGVVAFWNDFSPTYDQSFFGYWCDRHAAFLPKPMQPKLNHTVLDFGAGTGAVALKVAPLCQRVVACDVSTEMLQMLEVKADAVLSSEVRSRLSVTTSLRHFDPPLVFDQVYANLSVIFAPDVVGSLRELHGMMPVDGKIVMTGWSALEENPLFVWLYTALNKVRPVPVATTSDEQQEMPNPSFLLANPAVGKDLLSSAGFQSIELINHIEHLADDPAFVASGLSAEEWTMRAFADAFPFDPTEQESFRQALVECLPTVRQLPSVIREKKSDYEFFATTARVFTAVRGV